MSTAATSATGFCGPLALAFIGFAVLPGVLAAAEPGMEDPGPYRTPAIMEESLAPRDLDPHECDLRFGAGVAKSPHIRERLSTPGKDVDYAWSGNNNIGWAVSIGLMAGIYRFHHHHGRILGGAELTYQYWNTTPQTYQVATGPAHNNRTDLKTDWQDLGLNLMAGYATEPLHAGIGDLHAEILGVIGGGAVSASSVEALSNGESDRRRGGGFYTTYGPRLGLYATRGDIQFGIRGDWEWTTGKATIHYPSGDHSTLTAVRDAWVVEGEIGYRF